jgi:hypothetical protein
MGHQYRTGVSRGAASVRRLLILMTTFLVVLSVIYRQRLFVRDPLGNVERNGMRQAGAHVFINYANDVMVEDGSRSYLVQAWNEMPGTPMHLACLQGLACLTDADQAATTPLGGSMYEPKVMMTSKEITFVDEAGAQIRIVLR